VDDDGVRLGIDAATSSMARSLTATRIRLLLAANSSSGAPRVAMPVSGQPMRRQVLANAHEARPLPMMRVS
jgi:hypothetical protein